jgi:DNA-binding CsgD family transcriptional regulator
VSDEAIELAATTAQEVWHGYALAIRGRLDAARGDDDACRQRASEVLQIAEATEMRSGLRFAHGALGFLALGRDLIDAAIERMEEVERLARASGVEEPTMLPWAADLVEAYVRSGRTADAERVIATLTRQVESAGGACAGAMLARCRGMVAEDFEPQFEAALALDDERPMPFERARTQLAFGRRLHRARRRAEARDALRAALAGFERLRARPWSAQVERELRAAGARRRSARSDALTPQESRVAAAVARGASNREIAAELFLSPKTIEFHLRQIYRKLGARSRPELVAKLAQDVDRDEAAREDVTPVRGRRLSTGS